MTDLFQALQSREAHWIFGVSSPVETTLPSLGQRNLSEFWPLLKSYSIRMQTALLTCSSLTTSLWTTLGLSGEKRAMAERSSIIWKEERRVTYSTLKFESRAWISVKSIPFNLGIETHDSTKGIDSFTSWNTQMIGMELTKGRIYLQELTSISYNLKQTVTKWSKDISIL